MEKTIDYLEDLGISLRRLSSLCDSLSCAQDGKHCLPSANTIAESYAALCDVLETKAKEIDLIVSEYYKIKSAEQAKNLRHQRS